MEERVKKKGGEEMSIQNESRQEQKRERRKKRILKNLLKDPNFKRDSDRLQEILKKILESLRSVEKDITDITEGDELYKVINRLEKQLKSRRNSLSARDVFFEYFYRDFEEIQSSVEEIEAKIDKLEDILLMSLNYPLYIKKNPDTGDIFG